MMGKFVPFEAWHAADVTARNKDTPYIVAFTAAEMLEEVGGSFSYLVDGEIVACGGLIEQWAGRHQAWMFFTPAAGKHMLAITSRIKRTLEVTPGRIEMTVIKDFELGHRWAKMLGFGVETPCLKAYGPAGEDHVGYVRVGALKSTQRDLAGA